MNSTERLFQAMLNRVSTRTKQKLIKLTAQLAVFAKDAPEKIQEEWNIFYEEVIEESNRLEKESDKEVSNGEQEPKSPEVARTQQKINLIRAKITDLSSRLEARN